MNLRKKGVFDKLKSDNYEIDKNFKNKLKNQLLKGEIMAKKHLSVKELIHQPKFRIIGSTALVLLLLVGVFGFNANSKRLAREQEIEDNIGIQESLEGVLSIEEIKAIAEKDAPEGASVTGVELENEDGTTVYKVKFSDGSFRLYDAKTGAVFKDNIETDSNVPKDFKAGISVEQARQIASKQRPGKTIVKIELENEEGKVVYSVRFSDSGRVDIDATNGNVLRVRNGSTSSGGSSSGSGSSDSNDDDNSGSDSSGSDSSGSGH